MIEADIDLLRKISNDDQLAFKILYKRYWKQCYTQVLRRSGNTALAEDLTQAIFISLWEKRKSVVIDNLPGYLFRALQFKFITHLKSQINEEAYIAHAVHQQHPPSDTVEAKVSVKELRIAIDRGIDMMRPKTKKVYTLSRNEYKSVKEIARKLNLSEKAVEYHITLSLKTMRIALKDFLLIAAFLVLF